MGSPLIVSLKKQRNFYDSRIKVLSPAKLNLYLNITGKYRSGFHRIESIIERISLCDDIIIEVKEEPRIQILSNRKDLQNENNLCYKAALLLKQTIGIPFGFKIFLNKKIPVGSGLGGGSSNAASTILGIACLLSLELTKEELFRMGAKLGSDVNFFLSQSRFAFVYGKGEKVIPFRGKELNHLVFFPRIHLSTKDVYKKTRVKLTKNLSNVKILKYAIINNDTGLLEKNVFNVLEKSVFALCDKLEGVRRLLSKNGIFSKVTGSGSAFYTILDKKPARDKIERFLPKEWLWFEVKTF